MTELQYIIKSLVNIDSHYYKVMGVTTNKDYQQAAENAFTAELYHHLKINQVNYSADELVWHFDLNKERAFGIRPDLVLHKLPKNRTDQRIYVEVKTNKNTNNEEISKDLSKLIKAVSPDNNAENLGFANAFYIIGNIDLNSKNEIFSKAFIGIENSIKEKINIIYFNTKEYKPQKIELTTLLK